MLARQFIHTFYDRAYRRFDITWTESSRVAKVFRRSAALIGMSRFAGRPSPWVILNRDQICPS